MADLLTETLERRGAELVVPGAHLYRGDALGLLKELPTQSVDLCYADPPYFLSNGGTTNSGGKRVAVDKGAWDTSRGVRQDRGFHRQWLRYVQRVLRPTGALVVSGTHHCIFSIGWSMVEMDWRIINQITWEKSNPTPILNNRTLAFSTETLLWASPNHDTPHLHYFDYESAKAECDGKQMKDIWRFGRPTESEKTHGSHTSQKPISLMERTVRYFSKPGDIVLDPFTGSGTTGIAAIRHGRVFVGIEQSVEYFDLAKRRILAEVHR